MLKEKTDYTKAVHYAIPVNGWEVSRPDGTVPPFITEALIELEVSWTWDGFEFNLRSKENETFTWKRGESILIADGDCIIRHMSTKMMFGFDLYDEGTL